MTIVIENPQEFKNWRNANKGKTMGFVPTMGALHVGHESLIRHAKNQNELVAISIYVNPTQFDNKQDLQNYPQTWEADLKVAKQHKVDAIFAPNYAAIYPDNYTYSVAENSISKTLCGASRPGHFDGVLSVVLKLLNIVAPTRAYFGEKDFQQLTLIRGMAEAFFLDCEIIGVPTVREKDGLAYSSRNQHLSAHGRVLAGQINAIIKTAGDTNQASARLKSIGFEIDYIADVFGRRLVAVKTNETKTGSAVRLIDNVEI
ncbi:MAG: panC [Hyphomonadaceae bacterium]|nr:MAG: panC [Hyphomonadaceae bacterium]